MQNPLLVVKRRCFDDQAVAMGNTKRIFLSQAQPRLQKNRLAQ
jgi:hypothetical protein